MEEEEAGLGERRNLNESTQYISDRTLVPCPKLVTILGDLARVIPALPSAPALWGVVVMEVE